MQLTLSGALSLVQLVAVGVTLTFLDRVGRRPMLLIESVGLVVSYWTVAAMIGELPLPSFRASEAENIRQILIQLVRQREPSLGWRRIYFKYHGSYGISEGPIPVVMRGSLIRSAFTGRSPT